jgi:hypothetical protein
VKAGIQFFQDLLDAGSSLPARSRFGIGRSGMTERAVYGKTINSN